MHRHNPLLSIKSTGIINIVWNDGTCTVADVKLENKELIIHYSYIDTDPNLIERDKNGYQLGAFGIGDRQIQTIESVSFKATNSVL